MIKTCTRCPRTFDQAAWQKLSLVGYQAGPGPAGAEGSSIPLEMRNCECRATLTVPVEYDVLRTRIDDLQGGPGSSAARTLIELLEEQVRATRAHSRLCMKELAFLKGRKAG